MIAKEPQSLTELCRMRAKGMRKIKHIVLHCTATPQDTKVESVLRYWSEKLGWRNPGYHFIVEADGSVTQLQPLSKIANGVKGYNANSIHISYIGGIDDQENPKDTRTTQQYTALASLVKAMKAVYTDAEVLGHKDFPRVNKACPSFSVPKFIKEIKL